MEFGEWIIVEVGRKSKDPKKGLSHGSTFSSVTFKNEIPMSLSLFQSSSLLTMNKSSGLLRAKGVLWFAEDRERQYIFQWSGVKRVEAISSGHWESAPKSRLVMIGVDKSELDAILETLAKSPDPPKHMSMNISCEEFVETLATKLSADRRFKEPCLEKMPVFAFGLKGSPLRGVKESQLNGALMRLVNGRGIIFLTADACSQDYVLQYLPCLALNPDEVWDEIRMAAEGYACGEWSLPHFGKWTISIVAEILNESERLLTSAIIAITSLSLFTADPTPCSSKLIHSNSGKM
ncbi:unnamed protein product [Spirodela intermedia]|uniref:CobW C-terminal domain-containing protein n=1 Tax=Spirodela intermedia TaxID=51605 RepID=A0A7I8JSN6_SPIIN|nr:unnamed protein product [Spirodela intermedia]CAA6673139.1 unnamed protein product [Spirodela intermedia]